MIRLPIACVVAAAIVSLGCSRGTGTLYGTVAYQGRLLAGGSVSVVNDAGESASAEIQPDGTYRIENCPRGTVKIAVCYPNPKLQDAWTVSNTSKERGATTTGAPAAPSVDPAKWFEIPPRFGDPDASGLTAEVSGTTEHNIVMQ